MFSQFICIPKDVVTDVVINSPLLVLLIISFLPCFVIKEVEERERIEKLVAELEKANECLTERSREMLKFTKC
jgi:di/tricarboxylate transporter